MVLSKVIKMCVIHGWKCFDSKELNDFFSYGARNLWWHTLTTRKIEIDRYNIQWFFCNISIVCACAHVLITQQLCQLWNWDHWKCRTYFQWYISKVNLIFGSFVNWSLNEFDLQLATNRFRQLIFFFYFFFERWKKWHFSFLIRIVKVMPINFQKKIDMQIQWLIG